MITTKRSELEVINSFNDLMKDTKEKQRINKLVKQYSNEYFMSKLSVSDLANTLKELTNHYQKYAYIITGNIIDKIKEENVYEEEYYDGSIDHTTGKQTIKKKKVFDKSKYGDNFEEDLEEELNNLVVEDYFKNLNKALEVFNFKKKVRLMEIEEERNKVKDKTEEINKYITKEIKETYNYYISKEEDKEDILYNFKYNTDVINSIFTRIIMKVEHDLGIKIQKEDISSKLNKELKLFIKLKEQEEDDEEDNSKIPMGWKAYAITKFINKMFK